MPSRFSSHRSLLFATAVDAVGSGVFLAGSAIFFTHRVGLSATQVGLGLSIGAVGGLLFLYPLGRLIDRLGPRLMIGVLYSLRALGFAAYLLVHSFQSYVVVALLVAVADRGAMPLLQVLASAVTDPATRTTTMARIRTVRNAGFATGGALAAALLIDDRLLVLLVVSNVVSFVVAALLLLTVRLPTPTKDSHRPQSDDEQKTKLSPLRDRHFLVATVINAVLTFTNPLLLIGIPLWLATRTTAPSWAVALPLILNTVIVVVTQIAVSRRVTNTARGAIALAISGVCSAAGCLLIAGTLHLPLFGTVAIAIGAVVVVSLGEVAFSAGAWQISFDLSPQESRGAYLSVFAMANPLQALVGPGLFGLIVGWGRPVGWFIPTAALAGAALVAWRLRSWFSARAVSLTS